MNYLTENQDNDLKIFSLSELYENLREKTELFNASFFIFPKIKK